MKQIVFASELFPPDPNRTPPPPIHHDDPQVMAVAKILCNTDQEYQGSNRDRWKYQFDGAEQDMPYYAEPYMYTIDGYIQQAVRVIGMMRNEGIIP